MKIHVVYDGEGRILAASLDEDNYEGPRPVASSTEHSGTLDVPATLDSTSLEDICLGFRVDVKTRSLMKR
jgi:hypothetical protein